MKEILLKKNSREPKYKQIVSTIEESIVAGLLKKGDKLPSLNTIKEKNNLSRDTVLTAFNELKQRGIIYSVVGKGYYVSIDNIEVKQKIFVLFDELNSFKEDLYNSFLNALGNNVQIDIFFHHFNKNIFEKLLNDNVGKYSFYVIMPANLTNIDHSIQNLPKDKVYILDQITNELDKYAAIYQNFEKDVFKGLSSGLSFIKKYKKIILLFQKEKQPIGILKGFEKFCNLHNIKFEVISSLAKKTLNTGELYVVLEDKNLIRIIKNAKQNKLKLAKDIGVISYNDTILKEVVENGITTISTDFNLMGQRLAEMILNKEHIQIENPSNLIIRNSI